ALPIYLEQPVGSSHCRYPRSLRFQPSVPALPGGLDTAEAGHVQPNRPAIDDIRPSGPLPEARRYGMALLTTSCQEDSCYSLPDVGPHAGRNPEKRPRRRPAEPEPMPGRPACESDMRAGSPCAGSSIWVAERPIPSPGGSSTPRGEAFVAFVRPADVLLHAERQVAEQPARAALVPEGADLAHVVTNAVEKRD